MSNYSSSQEQQSGISIWVGNNDGACQRVETAGNLKRECGKLYCSSAKAWQKINQCRYTQRQHI